MQMAKGDSSDDEMPFILSDGRVHIVGLRDAVHNMYALANSKPLISISRFELVRLFQHLCFIKGKRVCNLPGPVPEEEYLLSSISMNADPRAIGCSAKRLTPRK